jgi:hypothetical protein
MSQAVENWNLVTTEKLFDVKITKGIDFSTNDKGQIKLYVKNPDHNMQDDTAAFEAWALLMHCKTNSKVVLSFKEMDWNGALCSGQPSYMRFLFRVWKFSEQFPWFMIVEEQKNIVEMFKKEFVDLKNEEMLINNVPDKEAGLSKSTSGNWEHLYENAFVRMDQARNILMKKVEEADGTILLNLFNQLPNGLFRGKTEKDIKEENRIFPTGYFDMWGIDDKNELCLFELKVTDEQSKDVENKKLGILSQLFFYANFSKEMMLDNHLCDSNKKFRGYDQLLNSSKRGITKIKAYFLASKYHPQITENKICLKESLNNNLDIEYTFLEFDEQQIKPFVERLQALE